MESESGLSVWLLSLQRSSLYKEKLEIHLSGCPNEVLDILSYAMSSASTVSRFKHQKKDHFQHLKGGADNFWYSEVELAGTKTKVHNQNFELLTVILLSSLHGGYQIVTSNCDERSQFTNHNFYFTIRS